jgi:spore maturation protein SpmB
LSSALPQQALGQANVQGQWTTLANTVPINPIHAALLSNGKVLVVAGSGNCPPSQSGCPSGPPYGPANKSGALLLDPVSGQTLSQFSLNWDMFCNGMVLLDDGRPFIASGTIQYDTFFGQLQAATFDPQANTFSSVPNMAHGRWYPTLVTLGDGRVMIFSGLNETGSTNTAVEFYSVDTGSWSSPITASWTPDLYPRLHLLPNGKVFYSGAQTTSKLFDPSTNTWNTSVAKTNYSGTRTYGTSVLLPLSPSNNYDPRVLIMGGGNPATGTTEIIDMGLPTPAWQYGPNMSQARIEMNAVILPNGKVLAIGGSVNDEDTTTASLNADLYDPISNTFSSAGANAYPRLYHSVALLLPDATVWFAGGNPSRGSYVQQMEIYKPAYLFNPDGTLATRPSITSAPSSVSYGENFTVNTPDNIASVVLVRNGTVTHAFGMDQREVGLSFTAGSGSLTVTAPPNGNIAPPGYYMLFLLNQSGVPSAASFIQITNAPPTPDFSVAATPSSQNVSQGNSTSYTVNVTPSNGFTGSVSFSASGLPSGATASFSPTSVSGSGSSTMTVNASSSTAADTYPLTITATSGSLTHTAPVNLTVTIPDFSVTATPSSQTVAPGKSTSYTVNVTPSGGFTGSVSFSVTGLPSGATSSFVPTSVSGSGSSTLTVNASSSTSAGTYPLTITATSGSLTHTAQVNLTVADFSIAVSPSSQTLTAQGNSKATYTVTISALGPFSATSTFSVSGLPARTSASFSPGSVPGKGTSTLTITAKGKAPSGTYPLTVSATGGGLTHSATVSLVIK